MTDLTTEYAGLQLNNPLVPSSSPLTGDLDQARRLEDAGCSALVLPSLFEEAVIAEEENISRFLHHQQIGHHEADSFLPTHPAFQSTLEQHLERIQRFKRTLQIPVIGSVNGTSLSGWIDHARDLQDAGCDAIELNLYDVNVDRERSGQDVENGYFSIVEALADVISIPFVVKLSSQITSVSHFVAGLERRGASGVCLFNRVYQADINLETLAIEPRLHLSIPYESLQRIRWSAILRAQVGLGLAVTGGFHRSEDMLKALLAGADVVHLCSLLLQQGPEAAGQALNDIRHWLELNEYQSVAQMKGSLSHQYAVNPQQYLRANYLQVLDRYTPVSGRMDELE